MPKQGSEARETLEQARIGDPHVLQALLERAKELRCLYAVSAELDRSDVPLEERLGRLAQLLAAAMTAPEEARVHISFRQHEVWSCVPSEPLHTPPGVKAQLRVNGRSIGAISMGYAGGAAQLSILPEEQALMQAVARLLSDYARRMVEQRRQKRDQQRLQHLAADLAAWGRRCDAVTQRFHESNQVAATAHGRAEERRRILLVDDHRVLVEGLQALFASVSRFQVVGVAFDGRSALRVAEQVEPELIIIDVCMPELNGADATRRLLARLPRSRVIALSSHAERSHVEAMLRAGASAYVLKERPFEELLSALDAVSQGKGYLSPGVTIAVLEQLRTPMSNNSPLDELSEREREVAQLLAEGNSTAALAAKLHISAKTVESHRRRVMQKLHVSSLAELTKLALREGLIAL
ncbi:MAG: response regulator transcription factor [Myxococcota bacterium]|jgi:DNA-binding NarL/FixJ family response regulator|nr:response regulator transcription factor [Myxococcota bacterium]